MTKKFKIELVWTLQDVENFLIQYGFETEAIAELGGISTLAKEVIKIMKPDKKTIEARIKSKIDNDIYQLIGLAAANILDEGI